MPSTESAACDIGVTTRSAIVGGAETGHHLLDIEGYSLTKELVPNGMCIQSTFFHLSDERVSSWRINYYPNGDKPDVADFISVYLEFCYGSTDPVPVLVQARFSLLDQAGQMVPSLSQTTQTFNLSSAARSKSKVGIRKFIKRAWLEESEHLKDDRFTIRCDVFVLKGIHVEYRDAPPKFVTVPPSDMHLHLGNLLETKKGADVVFQVAGETFQAHRCVLAARSPVFEAELFGPMMEGTNNTAVVSVDDMDAQVFGALLHFLYTDTLPGGSDSELVQEAAIAQHLLVAADRYNLGRLKLICEESLCKHVDMDSVVTSLLLAEQHQCVGLKKACFKFLSSSLILNAVMATEDFDHLTRNFPSVLKELLSNIAAHQ